jgi:hypothetical protein
MIGGVIKCLRNAAVTDSMIVVIVVLVMEMVVDVEVAFRAMLVTNV